ncbi:MAG TPA: hypothetical protein VFX22_03385, partial [Candidatus Kapabacteria bacterium]|nr:hypothetical protein [Candidatus Kapabacteria bacterium]
MLIIRSEQLKELQRERDRPFIRQLAHAIEEHYPDHPLVESNESFFIAIYSFVLKARSYGIT